MYSGKTLAGVLARCPFFESESRYGVTCEGPIEGSKLLLRFGSEKEKQEHIESFCLFYPNGCPIALMEETNYTID